MDLCDIREIKALLARHGFHFSKSMGQNFLIQSWVPRDIAAASGAGPGVGVLEIGPGIGPPHGPAGRAGGQGGGGVELDRSLCSPCWPRPWPATTMWRSSPGTS